jgi:outer membrane protein OmpU
VRAFLLGAAAYAVLAGPAEAQDFSDWTVSPYETTIGDDLQLKLSGTANGSAYAADQPDAAGLDQSGVTGAAVFAASLQRTYDSGLSISLKSSFQLYHDRLSIDNYGGDFVEKVYGVVQTGLGRVEIGNADGAAYTLAVTGPVVEGDISIDNTNASFFKDPTTGQTFINVFALNSATEASLNFAKISYYSPRLFGVQVAASFTPSEGKDVVPFLNDGPDVPDRQNSIWEAAASYTGYFGPVSLGLSGGWSVAHDDNKTPGHAGLADWSLGAQADYALSDDVKLSLGGAYRRSNAYTFDINNAFNAGETVSNHLSATITTGPWIVGGELGEGTADGRLGSPDLSVHGASATVGYVLNSNLQLNVGWERFLYKRDTGVFYNGAPRATMDAGFLHLQFQV